MPQYRQPGLARRDELDQQADDAFAEGVVGRRERRQVRPDDGRSSRRVLFLVGISTHFPLRGVRYALVGLGSVLLVVSLVQLAQLPRPPS